MEIWANYVKTDYSSVPNIGPVNANKLIKELGVDVQKHCADMDTDVSLKFKNGLSAYNHSLAYDARTRKVVSLSGLPLPASLHHLVGTPATDPDEAELHARGILSPEGLREPLPPRQQMLVPGIPTPQALTPSMVPGAVLVDAPNGDQLKLWFKTRGQPYPKDLWNPERAGKDALVKDAIRVAKNVCHIEAKREAAGQAIPVQDPTGLGLCDYYQDEVRLYPSLSKFDSRVDFPAFEPITSLELIGECFPCMDAKVIHEYYEDKYNADHTIIQSICARLSAHDQPQQCETESLDPA